MSISSLTWGTSLLCLWNSCQASNPAHPPLGALPAAAVAPAVTENAALRQQLERHVRVLAGDIGERHLAAPGGLDRAAAYVRNQLADSGLATESREYRAKPGLLRRKWAATGYTQQTYRNVVGEIRGTTRPEEIVIVGAHYDSVAIPGCRGANDNASGVAATLELARAFAGRPQARTLRFVAFANEEPPFFWSAGMGSYVYAKECRAKNEQIVAMLTPETIGYYSDQPGSQHYPLPFFSWFYPRTGIFA
ncbi:MAG: M28 family peptidase, partial [Lentisphaeria bacterium]